MTTLAAFQGDGWTVIGSDSRATDSNGRYFDLAGDKVVRVGKYLIAAAGASRGANILQYGWTPPKPPATNDVKIMDKFITRTFIPSMRKIFVESGYEMKGEYSPVYHDSALLVIVNGLIYPIDFDYSWDRDKRNIYFTGSGGSLAAAAMVALDIDEAENMDEAAAIINRAIEIACEWDVYSSEPIVVKGSTFS